MPLGLERIKNFLKDVQTQIDRERELVEACDDSDASAAVNVDSVTTSTAKSVIEEMLTELLNVAGGKAVQARQQEFSTLVKANREKGWKIGWRGQTDVSVGNGAVKFADPNSQAHPFGLDRIKNFLKDVQIQIIDKKTKS